ncbi:TrkH family potassium uptake protein [Vagococcus carniphilus]|uniref:Ktr system potassium uptake protein D n=1 Tax=Vagococcus carniphilus TaxID=218144 RepID=A0A430AWI6_9ENTE|nr:potassium transporter TrkG [Vagococcus carniphilus]MDT2815077.1 potassium transporter TrkG [Vagococcus carniphilus]MDT2831563.1 potassium transporter TrkG [Vagococcus carniphilus]MDT2840529.1 potassium transporter TrkG [Vagococcus carniphilus]MDT2850048.1 potassium transporter TrkG [Vagococcus carniphilus]MDT2855187.1 potassium transporter TrkG [Vagococcus carniphilus]
MSKKKWSLFYLRRSGNKFVNTHLSTIQIIFSYYVLMTLVSFVLLSLPFFHRDNVTVSMFDMLFMAISTVSVTGLSTFNINEVFNERGVILLEILFQIGGLGIMMFSTFFFILSRKRISLKRRQLIMTDMNQPRLSGSVKLIKNTVYTLLIIQFIFGIIFSLRFYFSGHHPTIGEATFQGFYQSISAVTNSGFDVTGSSATPYATDYLFISILIILIMIGGIGFPVIMEIKEWLLYRRGKNDLPFRFSLFSKLAISIYLILFVFGTLSIYLLERNHLFSSMPESQKWMTSMFYSTTTRNAGLQMHDLSSFQTPTLLLFSMLMFIGCSPSSVGGGVRTTTIAILGLYMLSFVKGEENVTIFSRRIQDRDIKKAVVVFNLSIAMCFLAVLLLSITEDQPMIAIILEVASAFGTTGLSLGITDDLTAIGKVIIAILMFIGRIGMLYTLMVFVPKERQDHGYLFPSEKIIIG